MIQPFGPTSSPRARLAPLLSILCALTACGGDGPIDDAGADVGPPPRIGICTPTSGSVPATGQFALRGSLDVQVAGKPNTLVAICPDPQIRPASILARLEMTDDGMGGVTADMSICGFELPTIFGGALACPNDPADYVEILLAFGPELEAYLPTINLQFDTGLSPVAAVGDTFTTQEVTVQMGTDVLDTAPLPAWNTTIPGCETTGTPDVCVDDFANIVDEDGDGKLGVTLEVAASPEGLVAGWVGATVRLSASFMGQVQNLDCVEGNVDLGLDFTIVDSMANAQGFELTTPVVIDNIPPFEFLPSSRVKILRADDTGLDFDDDDDGIVTCAEIINNEGQFQR